MGTGISLFVFHDLSICFFHPLILITILLLLYIRFKIISHKTRRINSAFSFKTQFHSTVCSVKYILSQLHVKIISNKIKRR